ncbi:unnamed protein product [Urochloa humidicola]
MAAAALLRSVASKIARAPQTHHRPLLARGFHGGARSGNSLPSPPTSNEQGRGHRFVVRMAAASSLRSLATKLAVQPPPPHHRLLHQRGLHSRTSPNSGASGYTPEPSSKMDFRTTFAKAFDTILCFRQDFRTTFAKAATGVVNVTLFGSVIYVCGRLVHVLYKLGDKLEARSRERLKVNGILTETVEAIEHILSEDLSTTTISEDQSMQSLGHGKQPGKERVSGLEKAHGHLELEAAVNILQAEIDELKNLTAEISKRRIELESARSEGKVKRS